MSIVFLGGFLALLSSQLKSKKPSISGESSYKDPLSGETVTNVKGKTPENYDGAKNEVTYLGVSKLIDAGMTQTQLENLKIIVGQFSKDKNLSITELSVDVANITSFNENDQNGLDFPVKINRSTTYSTSVRFIDFSDITVSFTSNGVKEYEKSSSTPKTDPNDEVE